MKIKGFANVYKERSGKYGFDYSIFIYGMMMAADDAAKKTQEINGDIRVGKKCFPVEIEIQVEETP